MNLVEEVDQHHSEAQFGRDRIANSLLNLEVGIQCDPIYYFHTLVVCAIRLLCC